MENNKEFDQLIKRQFSDRELTPSNSAWERMVSKLEEEEQQTAKRRHWRWLNIAAAVVVLFSVALWFTAAEKPLSQPEEMAETSIDSMKTREKDSNKEQLHQKSAPQLAKNSTTIAMTKRIKASSDRKSKDEKTVLVTQVEADSHLLKEVGKMTPLEEVTAPVTAVAENRDHQLNTSKEQSTVNKTLKQQSRIQVSGDDLLYAVTHNAEEVKQYYIAQRMTRKSMLDSIRKEFTKFKLNIDAEEFLAAAEEELINEEFKGDFLDKLKIKISDIAVAVAERNK